MPAMRELARLSIDAESFLPALAAGEVDSCLAYIKRAGNSGQLGPGLNCHLAEALLHRGRRDEAVECVRRSLPRADDDAAMLRVCAWVLSNCGCHAEAAGTYRRLAELYPDALEFSRHASGSLGALGLLSEAI